jgi:hypothetical protein
VSLDDVYWSMPDDARRRVDAVQHDGLRRLCIELWTCIGDHHDNGSTKPSQAEDTVRMALEGKFGTELQKLVEERMESFKRRVQRFPHEAKREFPEQYWKLVHGSVRAIQRVREGLQPAKPRQVALPLHPQEPVIGRAPARDTRFP